MVRSCEVTILDASPGTGIHAWRNRMRQSSSNQKDAMARRALLKRAGLGLSLGAGFVGPVASRHGSGLGLLAGFSTAAKAEMAGPPDDDKPVWSGEYWTRKRVRENGGTAENGREVKLNLWRKRIGAPGSGAPPLPVLFLVHGSSNSARTSFDLAVPGKGEYSLMNVFARYGYDVWTMDHDGYGYSGNSGNNSDVASSVADLAAALPVLRQETGRSTFHFYGTSSGAIRAAAFAQAQPEAIDRLVLVAFTYKGTGSPTLRDRAKQVDFYRANNRRTRDRAMIRTIFTRDSLPSSYDMAVAETLADEELKFGDQVPTGTYLDMTANLPLVDPGKILCPVAMIRGDHDGIATMEDLLDFYRQLPNGDRVFVSLPNTAHSPVYANNRHLLWYAMRSFLAAPAPAM
jgi:alpha-beta hydrolase superfamily lysophospholipase